MVPINQNCNETRCPNPRHVESAWKLQPFWKMAATTATAAAGHFCDGPVAKNLPLDMA